MWIPVSNKRLQSVCHGMDVLAVTLSKTISWMSLKVWFQSRAPRTVAEDTMVVLPRYAISDWLTGLNTNSWLADRCSTDRTTSSPAHGREGSVCFFSFHLPIYQMKDQWSWSSSVFLWSSSVTVVWSDGQIWRHPWIPWIWFPICL